MSRLASFLLSYFPGTVKDLPIVSPIASSLKNAWVAGAFAMPDLISAFASDPFLGAKLLGVANSVFFNTNHQPVYTIEAALDRVGADYASDLLRTATVSADAEKLNELWVHSIMVAHVARELAQHVKGADIDADAVFLFALIHDIGYFVEIHYDMERLSTISEGVHRGESTAHYETHISLGESLARFWSIPNQAKDVIRWHHEPDGCPSSDSKRVASLIYVAEAIATAATTAIPMDVASLQRSAESIGLALSVVDSVANVARKTATRWSDAYTNPQR